MSSPQPRLDAAKTESLVRRAIDVAASARSHGNHPFGAVFYDPVEDKIVCEAENTVVTETDATGHAETNLVRKVCKQSADVIGRGILVTSTEPCAMCSGAIYWAGINAVVFGLTEEHLYEITGANPENPTLLLPCKRVFECGQRPIVVEGPVLEEDARRVHEGFWH
eukprot:Opistho-2@73434